MGMFEGKEKEVCVQGENNPNLRPVMTPCCRMRRYHAFLTLGTR
jgi:hypothetical protein